ncbi:hypothetical protein ANN_25156, partial [Periplaneta americana]
NILGKAVSSLREYNWTAIKPRHISNSRGSRQREVSVEGAPYMCTRCGRKYKWKASLKSHLVHECGKEPQFKKVVMEDFVSVYNSLETSEIRGVDDMIANHAATTIQDEDSDEEIESAEECVPHQTKSSEQ